MFISPSSIQAFRLGFLLVLLLLLHQGLSAKEPAAWLDEPAFESSVEVGGEDCPSTDFHFPVADFNGIAPSAPPRRIACAASRCSAPALALPAAIPQRPIYLLYHCLKILGKV